MAKEAAVRDRLVRADLHSRRHTKEKKRISEKTLPYLYMYSHFLIHKVLKMLRKKLRNNYQFY